MKHIVQMSYQVCKEDNVRKGLVEEREGFPATESEHWPPTYGFDLVGISPRLPRFWGRGVQGRPADSLRKAEQIAGRSLDMVLVAPLDAILANGTLKTEFAFMTYGAIAFIAGTSLEKIVGPRSLESDRDGRQIHRVTFLPDLDRMDAVWTAPEGHIARLVQIEKGIVCQDLGNERAFDQDGEDDDQLTIMWTSKLGRRELKALRTSGNERRIHDGREYVQTQNEEVLSSARLILRAADGKLWVALDQKGPINTLRNVLPAPFHLTSTLNDLARDVVESWFGFRLGAGHSPIVRLYRPS